MCSHSTHQQLEAFGSRLVAFGVVFSFASGALILVVPFQALARGPARQRTRHTSAHKLSLSPLDAQSLKSCW